MTRRVYTLEKGCVSVLSQCVGAGGRVGVWVWLGACMCVCVCACVCVLTLLIHVALLPPIRGI